MKIAGWRHVPGTCAPLARAAGRLSNWIVGNGTDSIFSTAKLEIELTKQPGFHTFPLKPAARYGRTHHSALRDRRKAGRGRDGCGLQSPRHTPRPLRRHQ